MKKTKKRISQAAEARLQALKTEVERVLAQVSRQIETAAVSARDRFAKRPLPALPAPLAARTAGAAQRIDTLPCPSSVETVDGPAAGAPWIRFQVRAPTEWGQEVFVVGNDPSLGNWSPESGLPLNTTRPPTWSGQTQLAAAGFVLEYKYVRKNPDGSFTWEAFEGNRTFRVSVAKVDRLMRDRASWPRT